MKCFYITDVLDAFEPTHVNVIAFNFSHKARESWERDSHDMRFKRLQHLLQKSNIYSKFLLTKMEQQQNEVWCQMWTYRLFAPVHSRLTRHFCSANDYLRRDSGRRNLRRRPRR